MPNGGFTTITVYVGRSGSGRQLLNAPELAAYHQRAANLATPEMLTWLHRT